MDGSSRADSVAAGAIGIGVGLIALQLTWLLGNRITSFVWDPPIGPTVAFIVAVLIGIVVSVVTARRLVKKVKSPDA